MMSRSMSYALVLVLAGAAAPGVAIHAQAPATPPAPASPAAPAPPQGGRGGAPRAQAPIVIGPSAPVPPEVAIPRPTPEELTQVNAAVQRFVETSAGNVQRNFARRAAGRRRQPARQRRREHDAGQVFSLRRARLSWPASRRVFPSTIFPVFSSYPFSDSCLCSWLSPVAG